MLKSNTIRFITDTFGEALNFADEAITYTITWKNHDGTVLGTSTVAAGVVPTYSGATPIKLESPTATFTFSGWKPTPVAASANAVYIAEFETVHKHFTATWKNYDGTVLHTGSHTAGVIPYYPFSTPTRPDEEYYTFTFQEWEPTPTQLLVDTTYTAVFSPTRKPEPPEHPPTTYEITWKNHDGEFLRTSIVEAGVVPTYDGATPIKLESPTATFTFSGWKPTPVAASANAVYIAEFETVHKHFTATWKNYDGTVLHTGSHTAGVIPYYPFSTPTRPDEEYYTFTFQEWEPTPTQLLVDTTYTAVFSPTRKPEPPEPEPQEQTFLKQALLVSKTPLDCTEKTTVSNFLIEGEEPTGTKIRLIFKIDDALYHFKNGRLTAYGGAATFTGVIQWGNKVSTLTALANVNDFVGKKVYPIIAMQAPYNAEDLPTIKVSLVTSTSTSQLTNTQTSPVYEIADEAQTITEIADKTTVTGQASYTITVRLRNNSANTDEEEDNWSSYMTLAQAAGKQADAVQFKVKSTVTTTDGTDSVQVKSIAVSHSAGEAIVSGNSARLFSTVQNYELDLQTCYVVVRHAPLVDAVITAYVNFMELPKSRELITIGTATGSRQELILGLDGNVDKNIVATSIRLYVDEVPLYNFDFSTELGTVILSANKGAVITASYEYDYGTEEWLEMTPRVPQPYNDNDGTYASRFFLNLSHANTVGKKISNVMIRLRRLSGSATESLGKATGKKQLFTLKHKAKPSTISFTNTVDFSYDEDSGILALVATKGTTLKISYDWQGESITVRSFAAGWVPTAGYDYQEGDYEYTLVGGGSSDYVLPTMAPNVKGGAKVGHGLYMSGDSLNASVEPYTLPTMSESIKGGAKVGRGLVMEGDTLNVDFGAIDLTSSVVNEGIVEHTLEMSSMSWEFEQHLPEDFDSIIDLVIAGRSEILLKGSDYTVREYSDPNDGLEYVDITILPNKVDEAYILIETANNEAQIAEREDSDVTNGAEITVYYNPANYPNIDTSPVNVTVVGYRFNYSAVEGDDYELITLDGETMLKFRQNRPPHYYHFYPGHDIAGEAGAHWENGYHLTYAARQKSSLGGVPLGDGLVIKNGQLSVGNTMTFIHVAAPALPTSSRVGLIAKFQNKLWICTDGGSDNTDAQWELLSGSGS